MFPFLMHVQNDSLPSLTDKATETLRYGKELGLISSSHFRVNRQVAAYQVGPLGSPELRGLYLRL